MFDERVLTESRELQRKWEENCSARYKGSELNLTTSSGIPTKSVYAPEDVEHLNFQDIGMPGEYPFTRGIYPLMYQAEPWQNRQLHGFGLPEHNRERHDALTGYGLSGYMGMGYYCVGGDLVTRIGYDPDNPMVRGRVGQCGSSCCNIEDVHRNLHDLPLEKVYVNWVDQHTGLIYLAFHVAYAENMGYAKEQLRGNIANANYCTYYSGHAGFLPEGAMKLMVEGIKFCTKYMPLWSPVVIDGYEVEEAGANATQELAFCLSLAIALTEECIKVGLHPDDFLPRFNFHTSIGNDFFEEIAKRRALRRMWAKIAKERFGCTNPRSMLVRDGSQTAGSRLIAREPLNNIVRATIHTLAGVLSGINGLNTDSYDEPICIPSDKAAKIALRTQQIILHETRISNVTDPLGGSYYLEWLTSNLEDEANKLINKIDERGFVNCWKTGWFRTELEKTANQWRAKVDSGEEGIVGLNKCVSEEEQDVDFFEVDSEVERIATERVLQFREKRDQVKWRQAMDNLQTTAQAINDGGWKSENMLMPSLIDAVKAHATMGEMMDVLRDVFGWGYTY